MAVPGRRAIVPTIAVVSGRAPLPWGAVTWYSPGSAPEPRPRAPARWPPGIGVMRPMSYEHMVVGQLPAGNRAR